MYERNQNEKTNKERISKKTRLYGRLRVSVVDIAKLQYNRPNSRKKTAEHHIHYDGRPCLARPELLRK